MYRLKRAIAAITIALVMAMTNALIVGCAPESSDCPPVEIEIEMPFDPPASGTGDPSAGTMHGIHFYVFDTATGVLASILAVDEDDVARGYFDVTSLPNGIYTFVAWGGGKGSYDLPPGFSIEAEIGVTTIDDFFMTLDLTPLSDGEPGDAAPAKEDFDDLFFATASAVSVKNGYLTAFPLQFTRNSNVLRVTVEGFNLLTRAITRAQAPVEVFVVGRNSRYGYDNTIDETTPLVRYSSSSATVSENEVSVGIKTLRLDIDLHADDPVLLYVRDAATKEDLIEPLDVLEAIMSIPGEDGSPLYDSQEDIDRVYEFDIHVKIARQPGGAISVTITINGWEIERIIPNLPAK